MKSFTKFFLVIAAAVALSSQAFASSGQAFAGNDSLGHEYYSNNWDHTTIGHSPDEQ